MYCFRENSNFPFSNQKIITLGIDLGKVALPASKQEATGFCLIYTCEKLLNNGR
jgi:hypothetical protein